MRQDVARCRAIGQSYEDLAAELKELAMILCPEKWAKVEQTRDLWTKIMKDCVDMK